MYVRVFVINIEALSKKIQDPSQLRVPPNIHLKIGFCTKNRVWADFDDLVRTAENPIQLQKFTEMEHYL